MQRRFMSTKKLAMFKVKSLVVLALLALALQDEVKCTVLDDLVELVKLSVTLIKDSVAFDDGIKKQEAIESDTHTEVSDEMKWQADIEEAIASRTFAEKHDAIENGTYTEDLCNDTYIPYCDRWQELGNCEKYKVKMEKDCRKACGICSIGPAANLTQAVSCNFEEYLCMWTQSTTDQFNWKRRQGPTVTIGTGPNESSTGPKGHYLYITTSHARKSGDKAILTSPDIRNASKACLMFKAHMFGSTIGTLQIDVVEGNTSKTIFSKSGNRGNVWQSYNADLPAGGPYKVAITGMVGWDPYIGSYLGDIAIDELRVAQTPCPDEEPASTQAVSCTFEKDLCMWTQSATDQFDWWRNWGYTPSYGTGPKESSTGPKDHYLYIGTSTRRMDGDKAILTSPNIRSASKACLMFKAHMFGSTIGTLQIEVVEENTRKTIFSKSGDHGNVWRSYNVNLPAGGPYKVVITGTRGPGWQGDIAIDELLVAQTPCPDEEPAVNPTQAVSCNFEKDLCMWTQSTTDQFNWIRNQGSTISSGTGPNESSTGPKGHYLYIETSSPRRNGDQAILTSPNIRSSSKACLMFKAHMFGYYIGTLQIEVVGENTRKTIFSKSGDQGNVWHSYNVNLPAGGPYKVVITGTRGAGWRSDIAIDEFLVTQTPCPVAGQDATLSN